MRSHARPPTCLQDLHSSLCTQQPHPRVMSACAPPCPRCRAHFTMEPSPFMDAPIRQPDPEANDPEQQSRSAPAHSMVPTAQPGTTATAGGAVPAAARDEDVERVSVQPTETDTHFQPPMMERRCAAQAVAQCLGICKSLPAWPARQEVCSMPAGLPTCSLAAAVVPCRRSAPLDTLISNGSMDMRRYATFLDGAGLSLWEQVRAGTAGRLACVPACPPCGLAACLLVSVMWCST